MNQCNECFRLKRPGSEKDPESYQARGIHSSNCEEENKRCLLEIENIIIAIVCKFDSEDIPRLEKIIKLPDKLRMMADSIQKDIEGHRRLLTNEAGFSEGKTSESI